jgi:hypothetical protein
MYMQVLQTQQLIIYTYIAWFYIYIYIYICISKECVICISQWLRISFLLLYQCFEVCMSAVRGTCYVHELFSWTCCACLMLILFFLYQWSLRYSLVGCHWPSLRPRHTDRLMTLIIGVCHLICWPTNERVCTTWSVYTWVCVFVCLSCIAYLWVLISHAQKDWCQTISVSIQSMWYFFRLVSMTSLFDYVYLW